MSLTYEPGMNLSALPVVGKLRRVSPSQINTFRTCHRLFFLQYVLCVRQPQRVSAARGEQAHGGFADWALTGVLPKDKVALEWLPHALKLPGPWEVESAFQFPSRVIPGVVFFGRRDFVARGQSTVVDLKTTSDFKWAKAPHELAKDPQAVIYATSLRREGVAGSITDQWWYSRTRGSPHCLPVSYTFQPEELDRSMDVIDMELKEMSKVWQYPSWKDVPPTTESCGAYGGCCFQEACQEAMSSADVEDAFNSIMELATMINPPDASPQQVPPTQTSMFDLAARMRSLHAAPATPPAQVPAAQPATAPDAPQTAASPPPAAQVPVVQPAVISVPAAQVPVVQPAVISVPAASAPPPAVLAQPAASPPPAASAPAPEWQEVAVTVMGEAVATWQCQQTDKVWVAHFAHPVRPSEVCEVRGVSQQALTLLVQHRYSREMSMLPPAASAPAPAAQAPAASAPAPAAPTPPPDAAAEGADKKRPRLTWVGQALVVEGRPYPYEVAAQKDGRTSVKVPVGGAVQRLNNLEGQDRVEKAVRKLLSLPEMPAAPAPAPASAPAAQAPVASAQAPAASAQVPAPAPAAPAAPAPAPAALASLGDDEFELVLFIGCRPSRWPGEVRLLENYVETLHEAIRQRENVLDLRQLEYAKWKPQLASLARANPPVGAWLCNHNELSDVVLEALIPMATVVVTR